MFSGAPCLVFSVFSTRYSLAPSERPRGAQVDAPLAEGLLTRFGSEKAERVPVFREPATQGLSTGLQRPRADANIPSTIAKTNLLDNQHLIHN